MVLAANDSKVTSGFSTTCRFQRLANSSGKMALDDFQTLPELQGNLLTPRIFQLFDANGDGYLDKEEFSQAIEQLGRPCTEKEKAACALLLL